MTVETQIKNQIKDYLRLKGWYVYHNLQGIGSFKGLPDLTAISKAGCVLQIEVKTPKGKLSDHQEFFRQEWQSRGGNYLVARNLDDVINYLKMKTFSENVDGLKNLMIMDEI